MTLPLAFGFAYAMTRSCIPGKGVFRTIALIPLLAPSLLSALSLIYWFGNQGIAKGVVTAFGFENIYGAPGIVIAECFAVFPHALMILVSALALADARLYEAAEALGTSTRRKFFTITLPGAKYGLISAASGLVHPGDDRLRHPQGDRRQLQHARHRRVQARHRPAGLPARRRRRPAFC